MGLNILLTAAYRPFGNDLLLPAGRLREPQSGKRRADIVIVTKCRNDREADASDRYDALADKLKLAPQQALYFSAVEYGELTPLFGGAQRTLDSVTPNDSVLLLTGIADPTALRTELLKHTPHVEPIVFPDHHDFTAKDLRFVKEHFHHTLIVTTEKDAARLKNHQAIDETIREYLYILPINIVLLRHQQKDFNKNIVSYVTSNPRNSSLSEKSDANQP